MGRIAELTRLLAGEAMELPADLRASYPELASAKFRRGGIPPRIAGWLLGQQSVAAITLWRTIFLAPGTRPTSELLLHELRHVEQFDARKSFPLHYIWQSLRHGYHHNSYEVDAREFASRRLTESASPRIAKEG